LYWIKYINKYIHVQCLKVIEIQQICPQKCLIMAFILVNIDVKNNIFSDFTSAILLRTNYAFEFNSIDLIMKIWVIWATVRVRLRFWRMEFNENQTVRWNKTIEIIDIECALMTNHVSTFSPCVPFWMRHFEFWPGVQTTEYNQS
jgi:hypothetical protein